MTPIHQAKIEQGKLIFQDRDALNLWIGSLEGDVEVIIRKPRRSRTTPQNELYWGLVLPTIAESTGSTKEELHEVFKRLFLTARTIQYRGKEIRVPGSTALLTTKEFGEYIERIFAEAFELGITIPSAEEVSN
jgi:hypothetical protein|tara:strand:+ start:5218 stop:5616 length:399 start_codon:yes stop_codon:yes gene_type:complete